MGIMTGIYHQELSGAFHTLPHNLLPMGGARSKAVPDTNAKQVNVAQSVDVLKQPVTALNSSLEDFSATNMKLLVVLTSLIGGLLVASRYR